MQHAQMSEAQRFERLRAQDGKPLIPPPSVHGLLGPAGLDPAKAAAAQQMWQAAATELASVHSFPAEERLYWCSFLLGGLHSGRGDRSATMQLAQQTLPLLRDPRHQQTTLGVLARNAAAVGDPTAANQALSQLHAQSEDLQIDTTYRFSHAYVAAARGDDQTVLQVLGYNVNDIPIGDAYDMVCAVLRANAHERQGRGDVARQQLEPFAATPEGVAEVRQVLQKNHQLGMLAQTMPALEQFAQQLAAKVVKTKSGISIGGIFVLPIIGIALFGGGSAVMANISPSMMPIFTVVGTVGFIALSFFFVGRLLFRGKMIKAKLMKTGVDGLAKILAIETTGTRVNHQPMFRFRMLVQAQGLEPFLAVHHEVLAPGRVQQLPPGTQLPIKVDPKDPSMLAILWG